MTLLEIFTISLCLMLLFSFIHINFKKSTYMDNKIDLEFHKLRINNEFSVEKIMLEIDYFLSETFNDYITLNLGFIEDLYIDKDMENKINKEVSHLFMERISPILLDKICLVYNEDNFHNLLAQKVYIITMNYVVNNNKIREK